MVLALSLFFPTGLCMENFFSMNNTGHNFCMHNWRECVSPNSEIQGAVFAPSILRRCTVTLQTVVDGLQLPNTKGIHLKLLVNWKLNQRKGKIKVWSRNPGAYFLFI